MKWSVLIADDEPLSRRTLQDFLLPVDWLTCLGETADGPSTVRAIDTHKPDLVFLDIRMPGASGLAVLEHIEHMPHVIFTTAYDQYAVTAFELQALDYLLKPFGEARFRRALHRARHVLERTHAVPDLRNSARHALDQRAPITQIFVRERGCIIPIALDAVERLEAQDDHVMIHTSSRRYLVYVRLKDFESQLAACRFLRIHRSHIVNLEYITSAIPYDKNRLQVSLRSGVQILASRSGSQALRRLVLS